MRPFRPEATCPLDGIRVLDLSRLVAGNMVSLQLADFGAEVIKIEDPRKGDPLRDWRTNGISVHWKVYARNKKSVTLEPARARRHGPAAQARRDRAGVHRELPARHARRDGPRAEGAALAQPAPHHRARLRLGTGRALSRQAGLRQPGGRHVDLRGEERLRRSPAGAAAARARRHDRGPLRRERRAGRAARDRAARRHGPGDRPAAARSDLLDPRAGGRALSAHRQDRAARRQPLQQHRAAQRL